MAISGEPSRNMTPTMTAPRAPMRNWPVAPMLKRPALKASPTDSPPSRSRRDECADDRVERTDRALDEGHVGVHREPGLKLTGNEPVREDDDNRSDDDGQDDRDDRERENRPQPRRCDVSCRSASTLSCRPARAARLAINSPISFLSAVRPSKMPTILPRYMTAIRSESSRTSSSSADTSRMAVPASRLAIACLWMNSMLPTSRPRVG